MSTPNLQRNAKILLELAQTQCEELYHDLDDESLYGTLSDTDEIYRAAEDIRICADRLNTVADKLMIEYRNMEHHNYCVKELHKMLGESYAH